MSDSSIIRFKAPVISNVSNTAGYNDWVRYSAVFERDEVTFVTSLKAYAMGRSKAKNKIQAVIDQMGPNPFDVVEYRLEVNPPASMVANNALIENLVYRTAITSKLITQKHLLKMNVKSAVVRKISLKDAIFESVTLTYLFPFDSNEVAVDRLDKLTEHARMVFCRGVGKSIQRNGKKSAKGKENNVRRAGEAPERTTYINADKEFHVTAYVKPGKRGSSFAQFANTNVEKAVYAVSEKCVRIEVRLGSQWLAQHQLEKPYAWKGTKGVAAYKQVLEELRQRLRVGDHLRHIDPQQRHMAPLSPKAAEVLHAHLDGGDVWANRSIDLPSIHQEILKLVHIDLEFPWAEQRGKAYKELDKWLNWQGQLKVPQGIADHCMVSATLDKKIQDLKQEVEMLMKQSSSVSSQPKVLSTRAADSSATKKSKTILRSVKRHLLARREDESNVETSDISDLMK